MSSSKKMNREKSTAQKPNAKRRRSPKRTDKETAIAILKTDFGDAPAPRAKDEFKPFDVFYDEMKERHTPFLPTHFDIVKQATQLRYGLERLHRFKDRFFASMEKVTDINSEISLERRKQFMDFMEMLFRTDGLKKLSLYEADMSEEVRKNNKELEGVEDWQIGEGFKRGVIGYHLSKPIDWTTRLCYDEPEDITHKGGGDEPESGGCP